MHKRILFTVALLAIIFHGVAQLRTNIGLDRMDFFYAGESQSHNMFLVINGDVVWHYEDTHGVGEISDAIFMTDGNILFAHQTGIKEINRQKNVVWSMDAPEGTEIHTVKPIGQKYIVYIQNGNPLKAVVMDKETNTVVREFPIPYNKPASVHGQVRNCCLTRRRTLLVAQMEQKKVYEFDSNGRQLNAWSFPGGAWGVEELNNGNILVTGNSGEVVEIDSNGNRVWEFSLAGTERYGEVDTQKSLRLANGNTLINNWFNEWGGTVDRNNPPVQCVEVTPYGHVVWELCSWSDPADLGPSTTITPLYAAVNRDHLYFGEFGQPEQRTARDQQLSNRNASPEAKALFAKLKKVHAAGKTLSGQMWSHWGIDEIEYIHEVTGRYPAIRGHDLINEEDNAMEVEKMIEWHKKGGIVTLMWHWGAPTIGEGYEQSKTKIDMTKCFVEGTPENMAMWDDFNRIASWLEKLRDAHVPVLWRPLHEFDGKWFWYGMDGGQLFSKLWETMYGYFTYVKKLDNLIWVLPHSDKIDATYKIDSRFFDIAGTDTYQSNWQTRIYRTIETMYPDNKMIPLHECGTLPDPEKCQQEETVWLWWMLWHTHHVTNHDKRELSRIYNHKQVITLDELSDF